MTFTADPPMPTPNPLPRAAQGRPQERVRLGDRLLVPGAQVGIWMPPGVKAPTAIDSQLFDATWLYYRKQLPHIPWLILDPVTEYYYQHGGGQGDRGVPAAKQFPMSIPPFPLQWVESVKPEGMPDWKGARRWGAWVERIDATEWGDRKSTRLNSSHSQISYAVFCLKKTAN